MQTTVGKILLKHNVPEHLKSFVQETPLDKKGLGQLFGKLSESTGDTYKNVTTNLARLGFETSTRMGSTVPLADLTPLDDKEHRFNQLEKDIKLIKAGPGSKKEKENKLIDLYGKFTKDFDDALMAAGKEKNHTLSKVIMSGARGSLQQYRNTTGAVILVSDAKGKPLVDFPIKNSFADGLTVPEYLLHSYGTRTGTIDTKLSVADSGYMSKQLSRAAMPIIVEEHDCGTDAGIPVSTSNTDMIGSYLARPVASFNKNNEVTIPMLSTLRDKGIKEILIRSPITCKAAKKHHFGAVCQLCVGKREKGRLTEIGDYVGISAVAPAGEALSQGTLNSKHTSSSASGGKQTLTGFKLVQQLANIPKTFQNKAAVSAVSGRVKEIRKLAQGGLEIVIDSGVKDEVYYVPSGLDPKVTKGQHVEEGDILSEGLVNAADIVKHKGVGEGRRYYADMMYNAFKDSGMGVNHRNFQVLAKGAVDHVKITHPEGVGNHLPDSIVSYQSIEKDYKARPDSKTLRVDLAQGKYLEEPVLHYSIGTKVVSSVINHLRNHGIESIVVNDNPPPFEPEMQRLLDVPGTVPDFAHWLYSAYLEKKLLRAVNEGATSSLKGPSPIMGLAYGANFGIKRASDDTYEFEYAEEDEVET